LKRKGGSKKSKLTGIPKLDDANNAGTRKSQECTLILTEGDSAKALAISGLSVVGRNNYGVFPLRGKLLNVRDASHAQIKGNKEIDALVKIMGLNYGKVYEDTKSLRYGHIMIMTDQDQDGSHIKGLLINWLHHFWPSLTKIKGFVQVFITPIVKATKGKSSETFYTLPEYEEWKESLGSASNSWHIKYYKGLGTSSAKEAKEYFSNLDKNEIDFVWESDACGDAIDMAFRKKRVEDRKRWLLGFKPGTSINFDVDEMSYQNFINEELILFSMADNLRSIPSLVDGFKPSQRKVLFGCFKRKLKKEIKVAQLAGYVSEHAAYHHGEVSLAGTIVNMAQTFVGSNNINLLYPAGQFGTRILGGKDSASPRYIFTKLAAITRLIFHEDDDEILPYQIEDGMQIEPEFYVPIIPMLLVNGGDGIGTGWSTGVPNYNPRDIIQNIRRKLAGEEYETMQPWYRGYTGDIIPNDKGTGYDCLGTIESEEGRPSVVISELPIRKWTQDYKTFLEKMLPGADPKNKNGLIKELMDNSTEDTIKFTALFADDEAMAKAASAPGGLFKLFKMETSVSTSNMHSFNTDGHIVKHDTPEQIMDVFYSIRLEYYSKRKAHLEGKLTKEWNKLDNKARFIMAVIDGDLKVNNRKKADLLQDLSSRGFDTIYAPKKKTTTNEEENDDEAPTSIGKGYDYLLSMPIWSLTFEKAEKLQSQLREKEQELEALRSATPESLWDKDLIALEAGLTTMEEQLKADASFTITKKKPAKGEKKKRKTKKQKENEIVRVRTKIERQIIVKKAKKPKKPKATKAQKKAKDVTPKDAPKATEAPKAEVAPTAEVASKSEAKEAAKAKAKVEEEPKEVEEVILSLADRLAARMKLDEESFSEDDEVAVAPAPRARSKRATKTVTYVADSDGDEDFVPNDDDDSDWE
jgi:DNA topoisomerase-2